MTAMTYVVIMKSFARDRQSSFKRHHHRTLMENLRPFFSRQVQGHVRIIFQKTDKIQKLLMSLSFVRLNLAKLSP